VRFLAWALACWVFGWTSASAAPGLIDLQDTFVDEQGQIARLERWTGASTIVAMEYSECRFVCSLAWRRLTEIQAEADRRALPLQFLIISIDPERDTPALWREYRTERGLTRQNWRFVTGSRASTDRVAALLGVRWWVYDGHLMHDFRIVRLDHRGRIVKSMDDFAQSAQQLLTP
jgi:protein SCO1/2